MILPFGIAKPPPKKKSVKTRGFGCLALNSLFWNIWLTSSYCGKEFLEMQNLEKKYI